MLWFALWVVLALGACAVFFLIGRDLWRKATALLRELEVAADQLSEAADRIEHHTPRPWGDVASQGSSTRPRR